LARQQSGKRNGQKGAQYDCDSRIHGSFAHNVRPPYGRITNLSVVIILQFLLRRMLKPNAA